jgi:hypothetical protein
MLLLLLLFFGVIDFLCATRRGDTVEERRNSLGARLFGPMSFYRNQSIDEILSYCCLGRSYIQNRFNILQPMGYEHLKQVPLFFFFKFFYSSVAFLLYIPPASY